MPLLAAAPPPFAASVARVTRAELRYSYRPGCPVAPRQLRSVRLRYWGFDDAAHDGTLVMNAAVVRDVVAIFKRLYALRFPIRRMAPLDAFRGGDDASLAADNTSA